VEDMQSVFVKHCTGAQAVSLTFPPDDQGRRFKVSYSGDCRPSQDFAVIGEGSTVLIHEATFSDDLPSEAKAKQHSTIGEALMVGEVMGAKAVVLTHFSQRYSKIPDMKYKERKSRDDILREISDLEGKPVRAADQDDLPPDEHMLSASDEPQVKATSELEANLEEYLKQASAKEAQAESSEQATQLQPETDTAVPPAGNDMKVCVAFDYMRVRVEDIARLESLGPALAEMFKDDDGKIAKELSRTNSKTKVSQKTIDHNNAVKKIRQKALKTQDSGDKMDTSTEEARVQTAAAAAANVEQGS
jgi:ribonuclease Z